MQFLKTLFWALLVLIVAVFAIGNWTSVPIRLWGGLVADVNLPLLLVLTFLAGLFPVLLYHHAVRWRMKARLATAERTIAELRNAVTASRPAEPANMPMSNEPLPGTVPSVVPIMPPGDA